MDKGESVCLCYDFEVLKSEALKEALPMDYRHQPAVEDRNILDLVKVKFHIYQGKTPLQLICHNPSKVFL
jgi:hypothetical protein